MKTLDYITHGAIPEEATLLPETVDITPFGDELLKPSMCWANWDKGFQMIDIPSMTYRGCRLAVGYYTYAWRGDRGKPMPSRSQAVVSQWSITADGYVPGYRDTPVSQLSAFFPIYDGVGFLIGKRRREANICDYLPEEEIAIAQAAAIGAFGMEKEFSRPTNDTHLIYRSVWAPGKAFDQAGKPLPSVATQALTALGLSLCETAYRPTGYQTSISFKIYGDARIGGNLTTPNKLPFTIDLTKALLPALSHVSGLTAPPDPIDPDLY